VLEEVWPQLEARVDAESAVLAVKPREMAKLALTHKHLTVKARTVNQRLYHQWCMDSIGTLTRRGWWATSGRSLSWQSPRRRRRSSLTSLTDSDNFFMIEPQYRVTGEELVRPGGISIAAQAAKRV
jgi:hypothetical protein